MRVAIIDCFDSFTYNLFQMVGRLGAEPVTLTSDMPLDAVVRTVPDRIILSPGPGGPEDSGVCPEVIREFAGKVPILGVCLGYQTLVHVFGGRVCRMPAPRHGKTSPITHTGKGIFQGVPNPFHATRYHSLMVPRDGLPEMFEPLAFASDDGCLMAAAHRDFPLAGVQFHPESIMTPSGRVVIENFLSQGGG